MNKGAPDEVASLDSGLTGTPDSQPSTLNFLSSPTAARSIQEAVDTVGPGSLILVTNGVYATGGRAVYGRMTNWAVDALHAHQLGHRHPS